VPNFVSFAASIAELAHGEKWHTQSLKHSAYLMPRELKRKCFGIKKNRVSDRLLVTVRRTAER